jgi:hypothetical protein
MGQLVHDDEQRKTNQPEKERHGNTLLITARRRMRPLWSYFLVLVNRRERVGGASKTISRDPRQKVRRPRRI